MAIQQRASKRVQRNLVSGLQVATIGQVLRRLVGFVANLYLLKLITPEAMGQFVILQFITMLVPQYVGMGLNMAIVREGDALSLGARRSAFTFQIILALTLASILWLSTGVIHDYYAYDDFIENYLPWLLLLAPVLVFKQILISQWQVKLAFRKITTADLVEHMGYLGTAILLCHYMNPLFALIAGFTIGRLASVAYLCLGFHDWKVFQPRFSWKEFRALVKFGSYVQLGTLCNLVTDSMIPVVLGKIGGPTAVGLVTWAMRIVWVPQSITNFIDGISFATFCRLDPTKRRYRWILGNLSQAMLTFTGLYLLVLNLFFPQLIEYVFGAQWQGSRTMVVCFSTYILIYAPCTILVQAIFANNGARLLFKLAVFNMVATWTLGAGLIYLFNAKGIAFHYLLMNTYSLLIYYHGAKIARFHWRESMLLPLFALALTISLFFGYRFFLVEESLSRFQTMLEVMGLVALFFLSNYALWARNSYEQLASQKRRKGRAVRRDIGRKIRLPKAG